MISLGTYRKREGSPSTGGPGSLIQLNEIPIPEPGHEAAATWSTEYSAGTDIEPQAV